MLVLTVNTCYHKYTSVLYTVGTKRMGPLIIKVFGYYELTRIIIMSLSIQVHGDRKLTEPFSQGTVQCT